MSFTASTFQPLSSMANSNSPRHWTYATADDKATAVASGYFDDVANLLNVNDIIWAVGVTGGTQVFTMIFVDAISAEGVVTTLSTTLTLA